MNRVKRTMEFDGHQYEALKLLADSSKRSFPKYLEMLIEDHLNHEDTIKQLEDASGLTEWMHNLQMELFEDDNT